MLRKRKTETIYLKISIAEIRIIFLKSILVTVVMNYFFFRYWYGFIFLIPIFLYILKMNKETLLDKKRNEFRNQFKELLLMAEAGQRAGYSVENSIMNCRDELMIMFGRNQPVCTMLERVAVAKRNNCNIKDIFIEAGTDSQIEDISEFGRIYAIAYERSGNMSEVMWETAEIIIGNIETENEIFLSMNDKSFELKVLEIMPFLMMGYIELTNTGYFNGLYGNSMGILIMIIFLGIYSIAYIWGRHILKVCI